MPPAAILPAGARDATRAPSARPSRSSGRAGEPMTIAPVLPEARDIMPRAEELIAKVVKDDALLKSLAAAKAPAADK